jgi:hypothetical protein
MRLSASDHDLGGRIMGEDFRNRMMDLASRGKCTSRLGSLRSLRLLTLLVRVDIGHEELRVWEDIYRPNKLSDGLISESFLCSLYLSLAYRLPSSFRRRLLLDLACWAQDCR